MDSTLPETEVDEFFVCIAVAFATNVFWDNRSRIVRLTVPNGRCVSFPIDGRPDLSALIERKAAACGVPIMLA